MFLALAFFFCKSRLPCRHSGSAVIRWTEFDERFCFLFICFMRGSRTPTDESPLPTLASIPCVVCCWSFTYHGTKTLKSVPPFADSRRSKFIVVFADFWRQVSRLTRTSISHLIVFELSACFAILLLSAAATNNTNSPEFILFVFVAHLFKIKLKFRTWLARLRSRCHKTRISLSNLLFSRIILSKQEMSL